MTAIPISCTYCAHWSALIGGSKHSRTTFEKTDREQLSPCAKIRYTNVQLVKLNARCSINC